LLSDIFEEKVEMEREAALGRVTASRFGFQGHKTKGSFFGTRADDACLVLSGPGIAPLARKAITVASNVSRFDLQFTSWTNGDVPHIALDAYSAVKAERVQSGRTGGVSLVIAHPSGECCYVNRRVSDAFGRIYDKATEAKLGEPRTVWRYEVEYKRKMAKRVARRWAELEKPAEWTIGRVSQFFVDKGVPRSAIPRANLSISLDVAALDRDRRTLAWLQEVVRVTVRRQVFIHGLPTIIEALGLGELVTINEEVHDAIQRLSIPVLSVAQL
jgi:hypothetical protein